MMSIEDCEYLIMLCILELGLKSGVFDRITINMTEYHDRYTISRLIGSGASPYCPLLPDHIADVLL